MTEKIADYLENFDQKLEQLIEKSPQTISVQDAADVTGISSRAIRNHLDQRPTFGVSYVSQTGRRVYEISTPLFVRWAQVKN